MKIDAKFYGELVNYGSVCPYSNALKKQATRGWRSGMFQKKKNVFVEWEAGGVTSKISSNSQLLRHQIARQEEPSNKRGLKKI